MLTAPMFGDQIIVKVLSYMWGLRITVVRSQTLTEERFRHNSDLEGAEILLPCHDIVSIFVLKSQSLPGTGLQGDTKFSCV